MPTAGKLVSALGLAGLAWVGAQMVKAIWPVEENFGYFGGVVAALGLIAGWRVIGARLGRGWGQAVSAGLTGLFALLFWSVLLLSFYEMIERALGLRYKGPVDALVGMFAIALDYVRNLYHWPLIGLLLGGAVLVGLLAEAVGRRMS
ncbi:MAG: hypothetical protein Kow0058_09770 [Roseovarius sp.]